MAGEKSGREEEEPNVVTDYREFHRPPVCGARKREGEKGTAWARVTLFLPIRRD